MKLTKTQRNLLEKMKAGRTLLRSTFRLPYTYFFESTLEEEHERVTAGSVETMLDLELIESVGYRSSHQYELKMTPLGKVVLNPSSKKVQTGVESVVVSDRCIALRRYKAHAVSSEVTIALTPDAKVSLLVVGSQRYPDGEWQPAAIAMRALNVSPEVLLEVTNVLKWAIDEAEYINKEVALRKLAEAAPETE